ncbi:DUF4398 domain-containing protein [Sorangium sp. So ce1097]|uniref:DUF4398 domain-containing protein n=1 Tax=Sorangium sp. So ce1097 TaxID=3133330 RepID=UPI003F5F246C
MRCNKGTMAMLLLGGLLALACASAPLPPKELISARKSYERARASAAAELAPADLHDARDALERAERAFADEHELTEARDLAYLADRRAQLAEALGRMAAAERQRGAALQAYGELQLALRRKRAPPADPVQPAEPPGQQPTPSAQARAPGGERPMVTTKGR